MKAFGIIFTAIFLTVSISLISVNIFHQNPNLVEICILFIISRLYIDSKES